MKKIMKGLVYKGPGKIELEDIAIPTLLKQTDALVKILKTTICGTDLGILKGKTPSVKPGTILGHEGVGVIEEVGLAVQHFKKGDHVIISCITSDGTCEYCKQQLFSQCEDGGWILGNTINGTQAEYVRIPHADNSLYHTIEGVDENGLVMFSDILPTGFEMGILNGKVKPGDTIAIIGAGPIGMSVLLTAKFFSPAKIYVIDLDDNRLNMATKLGANTILNSGKVDVIKKIMSETKDGVDVAIEAVGLPASFDICQGIIRPGGHIANVGVHGHSVDLHLQDLWNKNINLSTGLVNTSSTPILLKTMLAGDIDPTKLITHEFNLSDILHAYKVFGNAGKEKVMKVIINT